MKLNQLFQKLQEDKSYAHAAQKACKRFEFQPFAKEFKGMLLSAKFAAYLLPSLSIFTGAAFLGTVLLPLFGHLFFAFGSAALLVGIWEYLKAVSLQIGMTDFFKGGQKYIVLLPFALLLGGGSVFLSLQGAKEIHAKLNTIEDDYAAKASVEKDSLNAYYLAQQKQLENELNEYRNAVSWKGKIDIHNKANKSFFQNHSERTKALALERTERLAQLEATQKVESESRKGQFEMNEFVVIAIVLSIEVFILLANWFIIFYDYKTKDELEIMQQPQPIQVQVTELQQLLNNMMLPSGSASRQLVTASEQKNTIGFSMGNSASAASKMPKESRKNSDFQSASAATDLLADVASGIRDYRYLMNRHKVNVNTVKEAIEQFEKGGAL